MPTVRACVAPSSRDALPFLPVVTRFSIRPPPHPPGGTPPREGGPRLTSSIARDARVSPVRGEGPVGSSRPRRPPRERPRHAAREGIEDGRFHCLQCRLQ
jgi:hypothetical protein